MERNVWGGCLIGHRHNGRVSAVRCLNNPASTGPACLLAFYVADVSPAVTRFAAQSAGQTSQPANFHFELLFAAVSGGKLLRSYCRRVKRRPHRDITPMIRLSMWWIHTRSRWGCGILDRNNCWRGNSWCWPRPRRRIERRPHGYITPMIRLSVRRIHTRSSSRAGASRIRSYSRGCSC
jgi:hypothetical protein